MARCSTHGQPLRDSRAPLVGSPRVFSTYRQTSYPLRIPNSIKTRAHPNLSLREGLRRKRTCAKVGLHPSETHALCADTHLC